MDLAVNRRAAVRSSGFSLAELLIASLILLMIILGILPLFTQATVNNTKGAHSMEVSNFARAGVEELFQLPLDSPLLTITAGNESVIAQKYLVNTKQWVPMTDPPNLADPAKWTRTATIRQYGWSGVQPAVGFPGELTLDKVDALPFSTTEDVVLKEIVIEVQRIDNPTAFGRPELTVRTFKSQ
ncbi:MAG: hypothetical protein OES47_05785 [Acidobacteriota bacterium]|nr:hypothetical protein [Acidobacteriota bacterium]